MIKWLLGIPYEVAFWESMYGNARALEKTLNFSHFGRELCLPGFEEVQFMLAQPDPEQALVLDVGCGMSFMPGEYFIDNEGKKRTLNIHYIDPLAQYYNQIAEKHKVAVPKVEFGMMEYLSAFYPAHNVTLIIIQNALDHSANPLKGIIEALHALSKGGKLYLNHHPNEAEYESYRGFHQFNICIEADELIIWNKTQRLNINDIVKDFASVETCTCDGNPVAILTKTAEVPATMLHYEQDIQTLGAALIDLSQVTSSPSQMLKYHVRLSYYRVVQRISKCFSWQTRQNIKKFIKKLKI